MHLWAKKNDQLETPDPSPFDQHLMQQGLDIETLAEAYIHGIIAQKYDQPKILWQSTYQDSSFIARADALIFDSTKRVYDLYEVKSSTGMKTEHLYDAAFQALVCAASLPVRDIYLIYVDKEYRKHGELDVLAFFIESKISEQVYNLTTEVTQLRNEALRIAESPQPFVLIGCTKPGACVCPGLCHPGLPEDSIYDIARIGKNALALKKLGILSIKEIPDTFPLSERQRQQVQVVKQKKPLIDTSAIKQAMDKLAFPLHFMDYETFNPGIPLFDDYHPYQHVVFQYSLHVIEHPLGQLEHFELLLTGPGDPGRRLLEHLSSHIGNSGSIIVWHKAFEIGRNKDMARLYPEYSSFLEDVNDRIFDLMEIFSQGHYLHAGFRGSASLKSILPVLVPEMRYENLPISNGQETMLAWWKLFRGEIPAEDQEKTRTAMLTYCQFDTLAMVEIWRKLSALIS